MESKTIGPSSEAPADTLASKGMLGLRQVAQLSAVDQVVEAIRLAIVTGALQPGSSILIADLAGQLGVSHIPVREAMRRLESDGLLKLSRGRQARVAPLSVPDARDVFHHLSLLEVDAVGRAVPLFSEADRESVIKSWNALRVEPDDDDDASVSLRHAKLHQLLVSPACGPWDWQMLATTWLAAARYVFLTLADDVRVKPGALVESHRELVLAVCSGTPAVARAAVRAHLAADLARVERALADQT